MYTWPHSVKRMLLYSAIVATVLAYILLGGGIIAFLALLAEWMS